MPQPKKKSQTLFLRQFAIDILNAIEKIIQDRGELSSRNFEKIKPELKSIVNNLYSKWGKIYPLKVINHTYFGTNFVFNGSTSAYLAPVCFWTARNSLKVNLKAFRNWIEYIPLNLNWETFQILFYDIIFDEQTSNLGITKRHLEILRFYARLILDFPHFVHKVDLNQRKKWFESYIPRYDKSMTYNIMVKNYRSVTEQYQKFNPIPLPKPWGLDCVFVNPYIEYGDDIDTISSLPIWVFTGLNENGDQIDFTLHRVQANSINKFNPLFQGLVSKIHFFWNFNHYMFSNEGGKNKRCQLNIKSPSSIYSTYEEQNYILFDSLKMDNESHYGGKYELLAPDWELEINFPYTRDNVRFNDSNQINKMKIERDFIKNYNLRFVDEEHTFFNLLGQDSPDFLIESMFKRRLYFVKLPSSVKGIVWIPFTMNRHKRVAKRIIPFLKGWLHRGPIIEYNDGILIMSYFPKQSISTKYVSEIKEFFNSFDLNVSIFFEAKVQEMSSLSIYTLPESRYFDEEYQSWNLPVQNLMPTIEEKLAIIRAISINEQNSEKK